MSINLKKERNKDNGNVINNYEGDVHYHNNVHTHEHDHEHYHVYHRPSITFGVGEMLAAAITSVSMVVVLFVLLLSM